LKLDSSPQSEASKVRQIEAWLTGRTIDGRSVIIGRTSVLLHGGVVS
jgi:hypothetical protein